MNVFNKEFLDLNRSHHNTLIIAGFLTNLTNETRQTFLDIIRQEFSPGYLCCLHCNADVAQMIKYVYIQYDEILKKESEQQQTTTKKIKYEKRTKNS